MYKVNWKEINTRIPNYIYNKMLIMLNMYMYLEKNWKEIKQDANGSYKIPFCIF